MALSANRRKTVIAHKRPAPDRKAIKTPDGRSGEMDQSPPQATINNDNLLLLIKLKENEERKFIRNFAKFMFHP